MSYLTVLGIIAVVAGLIILIQPALLPVVVSALLIGGGAIAIYVGTGRTKTA